jgi:electron transport complex protein RnfA
LDSLFGNILAAALVNNLALVQLLGASSLLTFSTSLRSASELGLISFLILTLSGIVNLSAYHLVLEPLQLEALSLVCFIMLSTGTVSMLMPILSQRYPLTARRQRLAVVLLSSNSAVIGLSLRNTHSLGSAGELLATTLGAAAGFAVTLLAFTALRQRLDSCDAPACFRHGPLYMISAGIAAMAMLGFSGLV